MSSFAGLLAQVSCLHNFFYYMFLCRVIYQCFSFIFQAFFMGILRIVGLGYIFHFNRLVKNCATQKEKLKKAE